MFLFFKHCGQCFILSLGVRHLVGLFVLIAQSYCCFGFHLPMMIFMVMVVVFVCFKKKKKKLCEFLLAKGDHESMIVTTTNCYLEVVCNIFQL